MKTKLINLRTFIGKLIRLYLGMIVIGLVIPVTAFSQGRPVSNIAADQINPTMTTDGNGGTISTWQSKHTGKYEIYAQRMNALGVALWTVNGIPICTQDSNYNPLIVSDGLGGAIIAWQSYRGSATADIYAQRVNANGVIQWSNNGVPVAAIVFEQDTIAMVSDGSGGAILTWQDYRSNNGFADIYAQRVNTSGAMLWTANGVSICNQAAAQRGPKILSDGAGGAFITWYDYRAGNYDIYTQRISLGGAPVFTTNGVATCTMATDQIKPDICTDGAGGVIITWTDFRSTTDYNIYAQRQGPALSIVWVVDGVVINNNVAFAQIDPKIVSDGLGGAIISWTDHRTGVAAGTADIYAQRVNTTGTVQWTATGIIICTASGDQVKSQLVSDGNNGAYITWQDHRNAGNTDIYAQRIASNAAINWSANGFAICADVNDQLNPMIVSNGNLGAFVIWQDFRSAASFDIYESGFNTSGFITNIGSEITVPNEFSLSQNYPNPFNPVTRISYDIAFDGKVNLSVYSLDGKEVSNLVNNQTQPAGSYSVIFNAINLPSGVYFYRLTTGDFISTKKLILLK